MIKERFGDGPTCIVSGRSLVHSRILHVVDVLKFLKAPAKICNVFRICSVPKNNSLNNPGQYNFQIIKGSPVLAGH